MFLREIPSPAHMSRTREIYRITLLGSLINILLVIVKFAAAIFGRSAAMLADAAHSLCDLITDAIVILFVRLSNRPQDADHDYGHGKYETLATSLVGLLLLIAGILILYSGVEEIVAVLRGEHLAPPATSVLVVALASIALKELAFQLTIRVGRRLNSQVVIANAWHHRSDAFSSIGTSIGIAGAIFLGHRWVVLDPLAAIVVSILIVRAAWQLLRQAADELLEKSLSDDIKREILFIAASEEGVSEIHNLRTRRIGADIAIEMHIRMSGDTPLYVAHEHASDIERRLRERFGSGTHIVIHVEPRHNDS